MEIKDEYGFTMPTSTQQSSSVTIEDYNNLTNPKNKQGENYTGFTHNKVNKQSDYEVELESLPKPTKENKPQQSTKIPSPQTLKGLDDYITTYKKYADEAGKKYGIDPSFILAHALAENGISNGYYNRPDIANNFFNIKNFV